MAVDQQHRMIIESLQYAGSGNRYQTVVSHDDQVRVGDDAAFINRFFVRSHIREYRRATALGTIARRILDFITFLKKGSAQNAASGFYALSATTMKTYAIHVKELIL